MDATEKTDCPVRLGQMESMVVMALTGQLGPQGQSVRPDQPEKMVVEECLGMMVILAQLVQQVKLGQKDQSVTLALVVTAEL